MIRQICPNCFQPVELADTAAGTTVPCPKCQASFAVPGRYTPGVDPGLGDPPPGPGAPPGLAPLPPPPGYVPPPPPGTAASVADAPDDAPSTVGRRRGVTVNPAVLDWFPAGCFTLILLLTLFPWVGLYPGGYGAYSQSGLGMPFRGFSTDSFAEGLMKVQQRLNVDVPRNWVMLVYLLGLALAVALAWADRVLTSGGRTLPPRAGFLNAVWPHRFPILAGLAVGLLALLLIQLWAGFGLETGIERVVQGEQSAPVAGQPDTEATRQTAVIQQGMRLGQYQVRTTLWLGLVLGTHVVAVAAAGLRLWLYRRGPKPLPRLVWEA